MISKLLIVFCSATIIAGTSTPASDLKKMRDVYNTAQSISMQAQVKVYPKNENAPKIYKGLLKKDGKKFYSEMMGRIIVCDGKHIVAVDKLNKTLMLSNAADEGLYAENMMQLDTSVLRAYKATYTLKNDTEKKITLDATIAGYKKFEITLDAKQHVIKKVYYEFRNEAYQGVSKVDITYSDVQLNKVIDASNFNLANYIVVGKTPAAAGNYTSYTIIDKREKN